MMNYDDFIKSSSLRAKYADDVHMRHIYEDIICKEENRIRMAVVSDVFQNRMPALQVCSKEISKYAADNGYELKEEGNSLIGAMVQEVLRSLGYKAREDIEPYGGEKCFFKQACWYAKENDKPEEQIVIA